MSAVPTHIILCDRGWSSSDAHLDGCNARYLPDCRADSKEEARAAAQRAGWRYESRDLCPKHAS